MKANSNKFSEENKELKQENEALQQQLLDARRTIDQIKKTGIGASEVPDKHTATEDEKTSDKIFHVLIENMHEGAVTINKEGIILYCNSCFADMLDQPLQKVIGGKFENFIAEISKENLKTLFSKGWEGYIRDEIHLIGNKRIVMPVLLSANTFELDNTVLLSIILTDVTHRNKYEAELKYQTQQLEQKNTELEMANQELALQNEEKEKRAAELIIANKEIIFQSEEKIKRAAELKSATSDVKELEELVAHKETILAILSHDLRSPLAGIIGMSEYLKSNFQEMEQSEIKEMLALLEEASKDELNMLDYLVEWARIKYASEAFSPKKITLVPYVNKVFDLLSDSTNSKSIHLKNEIDENITVFADVKMLHSILQNLISNAIKHSLPDGEITVSAQRKEKDIVVEVKDNGIGMSKMIQKKLFTPQMDSLSRERDENKGAGIGLLLVKGFLEKNGGKIWVESSEGNGSSFYFTLPSEETSDKTEISTDQNE
ncbi:signal transduction histidine kinase [Flavobacterium limnosediminis JC2902]|uniref:histidine kinase n=1 Tax=Flavobacterium limnosediminis JC2902 TaxID=1341181 RepID=V6SP02_9FLAO|nr:ATP-binding protein [Flavobacterium limnosediminis]ESU28346.1 signal transduction histidine kinase [Flavobacterium limnosediminis JC2902]